jgi:hypothetical protein
MTIAMAEAESPTLPTPVRGGGHGQPGLCRPGSTDRRNRGVRGRSFGRCRNLRGYKTLGIGGEPAGGARGVSSFVVLTPRE